MRYCNNLYFGVAFFLCQSALSQTIAEQLNETIEQQLPNATVGVLIKNAKTGEVIYSRNADTLLSPASGIKLFTASAALYQLKPNFRFNTTLAQDNHNYWIQFTGSPSFTEENLGALLLNLKKNKIKTIQGNIIIDSAQYQAPNYPSGTSYDDLGWYYAAPDTAVIINENKVPFELISATKLGDPAQIQSKTASQALTLINQVTTVSKEERKGHCSLNLELRSTNTIRLFGCITQEKNPKLIELAIPDPLLFVTQSIKKILLQNNITLKGAILSGILPTHATVITTFYSDTLDTLLTHMLQESDNLYANSFTKKLGYIVTGKGTHKEGAYAIKKILTEHTHLDMSQLVLVDGEGTRYNLVTPKQMVTLLSNLYEDKNIRPILFNALPRAGVSGTLKERMRKTPLEKKVFAKTGSMHDISSLSGFLVTPNDETYIFSIIINGINKPLVVAKSLEEKILMAVDQTFD